MRDNTATNSNHSYAQHALTIACAIGLLTLGFASVVSAGSVPVGVTGGQGGATGNSRGGAAGNGGQGGNAGSAGVIGTGGRGGNGGAAGSGSSAGGTGGTVGLLATVSSTVTGTAGGTGGFGGYNPFGGGGGGGGGGDGVFAAAGVTITHPVGSTLTGGNGGSGGNGYNYYGGSGGGGGNGVEFSGAGSLVNQGAINGAAGGFGGSTGVFYPTGPSGSGGGHGVVGAGITITNSGTIAGGPAGGFGSGPIGAAGTAGNAIVFTGGANSLNLLTGSTITGTIELATGASGMIQPQNSGLTLSSSIVLDANTSYIYFNTTSASLTVSGVISGSGNLFASGSNTYPLILTAANTFSGVTTVKNGSLQVDGNLIGNTIIAPSGTGALGGAGTVGNITLDSGGTLAPGDSVGTLHGTSLVWNGGGAFNFQLGSTNATTNTDRLALTSALTKGNTGTFVFHFSDGTGAPHAGVTYTLVTFGSTSGFSASDFSYDYTGVDSSLNGTFKIESLNCCKSGGEKPPLRFGKVTFETIISPRRRSDGWIRG